MEESNTHSTFSSQGAEFEVSEQNMQEQSSHDGKARRACGFQDSTMDYSGMS